MGLDGVAFFGLDGVVFLGLDGAAAFTSAAGSTSLLAGAAPFVGLEGFSVPPIALSRPLALPLSAAVSTVSVFAFLAPFLGEPEG